MLLFFFFFFKASWLSQFIPTGYNFLMIDRKVFLTVTYWLLSRGLVGSMLSLGHRFVNTVLIITELVENGKVEARKTRLCLRSEVPLW